MVRLETRPANIEGKGEVNQRALVRNALRMRPDRIILGEIRGAECFDLLAAMNTGHDGSMCTLHANSPRECLGRMENMILMGDIKIPKEAISRQIAESVDLIVQVKRLRDGSRRTTNITEVIGMEGDVIVTQELFKFEYLDESEDGKILGEFRSSGLRPYTPPADVFDIFLREFERAYEEGGLFLLTMHPHVIGYRSRIWILEQLLAHIRQRPDVWVATHADIARYVQTQCPA